MAKHAFLATITAAALTASGHAAAGEPFVVSLLSTPAGIDAACKRLIQIGIHCIDRPEDAIPAHLGAGGLPLSRGEYAFLDQQDRPAVRGFLILEKQASSAGNPFYHATAAVYKTGFAGIGTTSTSLYDRPFWKFVGDDIPLALPGSQEESDFLTKMDAQIAAEKQSTDIKAARAAAREEQRAAASAEAASESAYRASPQYARDQARLAVENCRNDIARARSAIKKDDRIAQLSGYHNALLRQQAATTIVNCEDTIARGGK